MFTPTQTVVYTFATDVLENGTLVKKKKYWFKLIKHLHVYQV